MNHQDLHNSQVPLSIPFRRRCTRPSQDYQFPDVAARRINKKTNKNDNNELTPGSLTTQNHADQIYHLVQQGKPPTSLMYQAFYALPFIFLGLDGLIGHDGQSCMPSLLGYSEFLLISHD